MPATPVARRPYDGQGGDPKGKSALPPLPFLWNIQPRGRRRVRRVRQALRRHANIGFIEAATSRPGDWADRAAVAVWPATKTVEPQAAGAGSPDRWGRWG